MIATSKIEMDLNWYDKPKIEAIQDDKYSRNVEISLVTDGTPWPIPTGATAVVNYVKADGTGGKYDTMPNGETAWSVSGNVLTVKLAPQVLTAPGAVHMDVTLILEHRMINTFRIVINVHKNVAAMVTASENYNCVTNCAAVRYTKQALSAEQRRQARENIGIYTGTEIPSGWQDGDIFIRTNEDQPETEDNVAAAVPYFDLSAMGLPAVPMDGTEVRVSGVDLTGIAAAMQKGPVRVSHDFIDGGGTFKVSKTVTPVVQPGYIVADGVVVNDTGNISSAYSLLLYPDTGTIRAVCKPYESSSGAWETIIDYTVPEDCATVKLATDVNGNPFSLKKAVAYVIVGRAADFATANAVIRPSFDKTISNPYIDARAFQDGPPTAPTEDGKATVFSIEVEKGIGNSLMLRNYRINPNTDKSAVTYPSAYKALTHEYERYDADTLLPKPTGIDAFNLGAYYTCIGAGTRIKVVGVRE